MDAVIRTTPFFDARTRPVGSTVATPESPVAHATVGLGIGKFRLSNARPV